MILPARNLASISFAGRLAAVVLLSTCHFLFAAPITVVADTTGQTTVSIEIVDTGALDVYWISSQIVFLAGGQNPVLTSFSVSYAVAEVRIGVRDTRVAGTRTGYEVSIRSDGLVGQSGGTVIPPSGISIVSINDDTLDSGVGLTLASPAQIIEVANESEVDQIEIKVSLAVSLPKDALSDEYYGQFELVVSSLDSGSP